MKIIVNLRVPPNQHMKKSIAAAVDKKYGLVVSIDQIKLIKVSLDARKKDAIVYQCNIGIGNVEQFRHRKAKHFWKQLPVYHPPTIQPPLWGTAPLNNPIYIIGTGPAGLFCGYTLAKFGYHPILIERGKSVFKREKDIERFWQQGTLDTQSNVQFGEGGAGTFSDGKLTSRSKDPLSQWVLETLHQHGAPSEILYFAKPHIGTDILRHVIFSMRQQIERWGGTYHFSTQLDAVNYESEHQLDIQLNHQVHSAAVLVLAIGHSARDTYRMLDQSGIRMQPKSFAYGMRIEHKQDWIDQAQYNHTSYRDILAPAEYQLSYRSEQTGDNAYTFCMCPGGQVIASSSESKQLVVNGMSYHARDGENANAALLIPFSLTPKDPLFAGVKWQEQLEASAFHKGNSAYAAPVQTVGDFMNGQASLDQGVVKPSYQPYVSWTDLRDLFPKEAVTTFREAINGMGKKLSAFDHPDAVLTGVETRTSAPIRILREDQHRWSVSDKRIYPCGEGAGYAGGIISSAIDGIKTAYSIIGVYQRPNQKQ